MESCCNNPPSETHATHNIAQRVDKLGWTATMKSWTMHESLYRWQFRLWKISWTKQCPLSDFAWQFELMHNWFQQCTFDFQSVWKTMLFFNNLRDGVKVQVYIQYSDTSGVQHVYTMHPCRALGSSDWDNCPEYKRCWVTIQSQRVQVELIFTWSIDRWMDGWIDRCTVIDWYWLWFASKL